MYVKFKGEMKIKKPHPAVAGFGAGKLIKN